VETATTTGRLSFGMEDWFTPVSITAVWFQRRIVIVVGHGGGRGAFEGENGPATEPII